jgi:citrate lyase beta subunit
MANLALVCNYEGDYGMKLLMVDTENTIADVARIARENIAGVFVPQPRPGTVLRVRRHGHAEHLPDALTVAQARFISGETIDIYPVPA